MFDIAVSVKYGFCMVSGFLFVSFFSSPIPKNIGKWSDISVHMIPGYIVSPVLDIYILSIKVAVV